MSTETRTSPQLTNAELRVSDPGAYLRKAAERMEVQAKAATTGGWHHMCMGSDGCQVHNDGHLRERKHVAWFGRKEWKADHADAIYAAGMQPAVALAVAKLLNAVATDVENMSAEEECPCALMDYFHEALDIAEAFLGDSVQGERL
jgi:hypothetical protein